MNRFGPHGAANLTLTLLKLIVSGLASVCFAATGPEANLDPVERQRVIESVIENLKSHYYDRTTAEKIADILSRHLKDGDYSAVSDGDTFANLLTVQMRGVSQNMDLMLNYFRDPIPDHPRVANAETSERYRRELEAEHCTFEKVEVLAHNVGYMKLNSFPDLAFCKSAASAAMTKLNHTDAIIFDLRDNRGGYGEMASLIAAYLFDHPEYMYNPRQSVTEQSWTRSPVPGNKLANKSVFVLISHTTISAAEMFCFNLKMLKRATFLGETTAGSAHAGVFHRIDSHFGLGIPEVQTINPYAMNDWEGTGIEPDVKVQASDALEAAEKLALQRIHALN